MSTIEILGFAPSTFVRTARMAAIEKGVDHALTPLAFKTPEHFALHPFGKMPVLLHGKIRLTETIAIAGYIDEAFAGPRLQPKEPLERARMWQAVSVAATEAYPTLVTAALGEAGPAGVDREAAGRLLDWLDQTSSGADRIEKAGVTLADLFVAPILAFHASSAGDALFAGRPRLGAWWGAITSRPSFKETAGS